MQTENYRHTLSATGLQSQHQLHWYSDSRDELCPCLQKAFQPQTQVVKIAGPSTWEWTPCLISVTQCTEDISGRWRPIDKLVWSGLWRQGGDRPARPAPMTSTVPLVGGRTPWRARICGLTPKLMKPMLSKNRHAMREYVWRLSDNPSAASSSGKYLCQEEMCCPGVHSRCPSITTCKSLVCPILPQTSIVWNN